MTTRSMVIALLALWRVLQGPCRQARQEGARERVSCRGRQPLMHQRRDRRRLYACFARA